MVFQIPKISVILWRDYPHLLFILTPSFAIAISYFYPEMLNTMKTTSIVFTILKSIKKISNYSARDRVLNLIQFHKTNL